jgi:hypothetical protein
MLLNVNREISLLHLIKTFLGTFLDRFGPYSIRYFQKTTHPMTVHLFFPESLAPFEFYFRQEVVKSKNEIFVRVFFSEDFKNSIQYICLDEYSNYE